MKNKIKIPIYYYCHLNVILIHFFDTQTTRRGGGTFKLCFKKIFFHFTGPEKNFNEKIFSYVGIGSKSENFQIKQIKNHKNIKKLNIHR